MSLLKTLAKVAVGVAIAKGVSGMMNKGAANAQPGRTPSSGNGGLLDGLAERAAQQGGTSSGGGLGDLLGQVLGGANQQGQAGQTGPAGRAGQSGSGGIGGLGGLLEQLGSGQSGRSGQAGAPSSGGGLGDLLGNLAGGKAGGAGGLGDLLGGLAGGAAGKGGLGDLLGGLAGKAPQQRNSGGTFGELLNGSIQSGGEPEVQPTASEEAIAGLMLSAMIQAAKCDGELDDNERQRLMENLNDSSPEEIEFVNRELASPVDIDGLVAQVPAGLEQQVYAMSVMGIVLDNKAEAQYLDRLAKALGIQPAIVNNIHDQLGVQHIYA